MTEVIRLVSCTKSKAPSPCAARDLYLPSDWFAKARRYVEACGGRWFILSAAHGLVHPDRLLAPYETSLLTMAKPQREAWARLVLAQLAQVAPPGASTFEILAGARYREGLEASLSGRYTVPMSGLGLGQQKAWLAMRAPGKGNTA